MVNGEQKFWLKHGGVCLFLFIDQKVYYNVKKIKLAIGFKWCYYAFNLNPIFIWRHIMSLWICSKAKECNVNTNDDCDHGKPHQETFVCNAAEIGRAHV